ncbi:alpha/beta hydrolase [Roseiconus nitratireducens]|uniref:Alpha/beta hydrolase n=1 Tax=Roseiconus nitratireducens TaxID=2605748 RepID=A0A5M6DGB9_9BACT|nr:alpha/beta hydrolase [Roseiconus nitratireducens]KAA5545342.1 alpha/beta hydrolase [Roseiconus nitratireducens]
MTGTLCRHLIATALCLFVLIPSPVAGQDPQTEATLVRAGAEVQVYKQTTDADGKPVDLKMYVFAPPGHQPSDRRSAIVFFFGGGWKNGRPTQFVEHCKHLASRGMVAATADYRVLSRQGTKAVSCVADGKSAVRWIRQHADQLGVDPQRIVAGGGSAGGHVAACTAVIDSLDEPDEDLSISSHPDALALFNPAVVLAPVENRPPFDPEKMAGLTDRMGVDPQRLSPFHHVDKRVPPTIIFHGRADRTVPFWTVEAFSDSVRRLGGRCDLVGFDGEAHGFFNYGRGDNKSFERTIEALDKFLMSIGFLDSHDSQRDGQGAATE